jgi:hypothetical protein
MKRWLLFGFVLSLVAGCGGPPTPTPDLVATHVVAIRAAAATLTAEAPTATQTPTSTDTPTATHTPTPTETPMPTATPTATPCATPTATHSPSPLPTDTVTPTATPTGTAQPKPTSKPQPTPTDTPKPDLRVTYRDFHYECEKTSHYSQAKDQPYWGYRSFQALMIISNNPDKTLEPPWKPSRWLVAVWRNPQDTRESTLVWEWTQRGKDWDEPPIPPGGTAHWTYMAFPISRWEYVKAAEFEAWGRTYHFEFPRPEYAGEHNFVDCGDYPGSSADPRGNRSTP